MIIFNFYLPNDFSCILEPDEEFKTIWKFFDCWCVICYMLYVICCCCVSLPKWLMSLTLAVMNNSSSWFMSWLLFVIFKMFLRTWYKRKPQLWNIVIHSSFNLAIFSLFSFSSAFIFLSFPFSLIRFHFPYLFCLL